MHTWIVVVAAALVLSVAGCGEGGTSEESVTDPSPGPDVAPVSDAAALPDVTPDDTVGSPDTAADASTDAGAPEGPLRENVQAGVAPNAEGQTPAFAEQTRAPQPAVATEFTTEVVASGLSVPWGMEPLPDGRLLVTERPGRLRMVNADGTLGSPIDGLPEVAAVGQGGLLDVTVGPGFADDRYVFFTFSEAADGGLFAAAVARGILSADESRLDDVQVLYRQQPAWQEGRHFGSRLAFDETGALFATFGDRGSSFEEAQSPMSAIGAVIRIRPDGTIPDDNPFADGNGGDPAVWSWGHRNIQSAAIGPDGALWTAEHGARGGDELNRPQAGRNYGWPIITYGEDYGGAPVGEGLTAADGYEQPVYFWDPVIAPSDMVTYDGDLFAEWNGDLFIGGLQTLGVVRLSVRDGMVYTEEWLEIGDRVRSLAVAADGALLVGTDAGEILALRPE